MDSNALICLEPSAAINQGRAPAWPKSRQEQVSLHIHGQIGLKLTAGLQRAKLKNFSKGHQ